MTSDQQSPTPQKREYSIGSAPAEKHISLKLALSIEPFEGNVTSRMVLWNLEL